MAEAAGELDFFFFLGSAYAALSAMRIERLADEAGVQVNWRPFSVRALMVEQNNMIREQKQKMAYAWRDIERRAAVHGLPFVRPPVWPTDPNQLANRVGVVAMLEGWCPAYARRSFEAWYWHGIALGAPESLEAILTELGRPVAETLARADSDEIRMRYDAETDAARRLGAFGSPTFAAGGEVFWGDDRLEEAIAWAAGRHPAQARQDA